MQLKLLYWSNLWTKALLAFSLFWEADLVAVLYFYFFPITEYVLAKSHTCDSTSFKTTPVLEPFASLYRKYAIYSKGVQPHSSSLGSHYHRDWSPNSNKPLAFSGKCYVFISTTSKQFLISYSVLIVLMTVHRYQITTVQSLLTWTSLPGTSIHKPYRLIGFRFRRPCSVYIRS